jgi:hypothetical protein
MKQTGRRRIEMRNPFKRGEFIEDSAGCKNQAIGGTLVVLAVFGTVAYLAYYGVSEFLARV